MEETSERTKKLKLIYELYRDICGNTYQAPKSYDEFVESVLPRLFPHSGGSIHSINDDAIECITELMEISRDVSEEFAEVAPKLNANPKKS